MSMKLETAVSLDDRVVKQSMARFSVSEAHRLVKDLFRPRMHWYWLDFLGSWIAGIGAFWAVGPLGYYTPEALMVFVVSAFALYRAAAFIHELVHFRSKRVFRRFRAAWNILCGIPFLIPVFMYDCHSEHHNRRRYGTDRDAEYVPYGSLPSQRLIGVILSAPFVAFFGPYRFAIMTPLAWVIPRLRTYVYTRISSLKLDLEYEGHPPRNRAERRRWVVQEAACLVFIVVSVTAAVLGWIDWQRLAQWLATVGLISVVNVFRLLAAHRYIGDEEPMSLVEQMMDTVNHPRRPLIAELWAPVGLRLHALHHLMPGLPYHAYPEAHRRLVAGLPQDSAYRMTESPGMWASLLQLWRTAGRYRKAAA